MWSRLRPRRGLTSAVEVDLRHQRLLPVPSRLPAGEFLNRGISGTAQYRIVTRHVFSHSPRRRPVAGAGSPSSWSDSPSSWSSSTRTVVNIALPSAQADLGFTDGQRQWIITAYSLAFGSLLLLGGRLSDLIGRKRTFIIGLIGFAVASALGGAAGTFELLVGRPRPAGRLRRAARPDRARRADDDLHGPEGARPRVRRLRRDRRRRRRGRTPPRRRPDRGARTGAGISTSTSSSPSSRSSAPSSSSRRSPAPARGPKLDVPGHDPRLGCACSASSTASRTPRPTAGTRR